MKKSEAIIKLASDITRIIISADNPPLIENAISITPIEAQEKVTLTLNSMLSSALDYHRPLTVSYILEKIYKHYQKVGALFTSSPLHGAFIGNALKAITTSPNDIKLAFIQPNIWRLYTFQDQITILQVGLSLTNEVSSLLINELAQHNLLNAALFINIINTANNDAESSQVIQKFAIHYTIILNDFALILSKSPSNPVNGHVVIMGLTALYNNIATELRQEFLQKNYINIERFIQQSGFDRSTSSIFPYVRNFITGLDAEIVRQTEIQAENSRLKEAEREAIIAELLAEKKTTKPKKTAPKKATDKSIKQITDTTLPEQLPKKTPEKKGPDVFQPLSAAAASDESDSREEWAVVGARRTTKTSSSSTKIDSKPTNLKTQEVTTDARSILVLSEPTTGDEPATASTIETTITFGNFTDEIQIQLPSALNPTTSPAASATQINDLTDTTNVNEVIKITFGSFTDEIPIQLPSTTNPIASPSASEEQPLLPILFQMQQHPGSSYFLTYQTDWLEHTNSHELLYRIWITNARGAISQHFINPLTQQEIHIGSQDLQNWQPSTKTSTQSQQAYYTPDDKGEMYHTVIVPSSDEIPLFQYVIQARTGLLNSITPVSCQTTSSSNTKTTKQPNSKYHVGKKHASTEYKEVDASDTNFKQEKQSSSNLTLKTKLALDKNIHIESEDKEYLDSIAAINNRTESEHRAQVKHNSAVTLEKTTTALPFYIHADPLLKGIEMIFGGNLADGIFE